MIYFDYAASAPCDPRVVKEIFPFFSQFYANPSNSATEPGIAVSSAVQLARNNVADFLGCLPQQIIWTSGATESNNLALQGAIKAYYEKNSAGTRPHIITSSIEHKSVLETCRQLSKTAAEVSFIPPDKTGATPPELIERAIKDNTFLVSIMMANNETGVLNDILSISKRCKQNQILVHTDATQMVGKFRINLKSLPVDFLSFSGHKIYGPKGVGVLYVRDANTLQPVVFGGGQEEGLRSGTLNVPGIIGISKACELLQAEHEEDNARIKYLRDMLENLLLHFDENIIINGRENKRLPNISSISFPVKEGINFLNLINSQKVIACSSGSACDSADNRPSHVMKEFGKTRHEAKNTLRISIGRFTTESEITRGAAHIIDLLKRITLGRKIGTG